MCLLKIIFCKYVCYDYLLHKIRNETTIWINDNFFCIKNQSLDLQIAAILIGTE